jgi:phosphohistidine swiveling domain-containing protein
MKLDFGSKAETLEKLHNNLKSAKTLPVFRFFEEDFYKNKSDIVSKIQKSFACNKIVVRSSAANEDGICASKAGAFESVLNIDITNKDLIERAIEQVLKSYDCRDGKNEVFCQPMLQNAAMAGVAFSCDLSTLAPYYIINYDESGKTDVITSGSSNNTKTYIHYKNAEPRCSDFRINKIIHVIQELEVVFDNKYIDVEFAIDKSDDVYVLQVRPISLNNRIVPDLNLDLALLKINHKIAKLQSRNPNVFGERAIFGVMPDWNPAEIIGIRPKKLALSLYKELVTDNIWAFQRDNYGYLNLRSHPLLISFLGVPFIDVRVDFNSFIPKCMDKNVAEKLVEFYLDKLYKIPDYHDKVEFKIIYSCYHLNLDNELTELKNHNFSDEEIKNIKSSLLTLTNEVVCNSSDHYKADLEKIKILEQLHSQIVDSDIYIIDKIYWLIEYCKRYGTLPFAGIARSAFIAVQFLQSFVSLGIIDQSEYNLYMNSLNTVSKQLGDDLCNLDKEKFLKIWGHLRPGTYDINSPRYDEGFDYYFSNYIKQQCPQAHEYFEFSSKQKRQIQDVLNKHKINISTEKLLVFIKESIEGRESSKFVFTKTLSQILLYIEQFSCAYGITKKEAAFLDISTIRELYSSLDFMDIKDTLYNDITYNKALYEYTKAVKLPAIILHPDDIYGFFLESGEANYITLKKIEAEIMLEKDISEKSPKGKIVFIKSADPGYDFLFTKDIAGLITQYGGANSHMSIRCAELGIPAVIGAGEKDFEEWSKYNLLEIDCANKKVLPIS